MWKILFKRLGQVISVLGIIIGVGAIFLSSIGEEFVTSIFNIKEDVFAKSVMIMFGLSFLIIIAGVIIWATIFSYDHNKEIKDILDKKPQTCRDMQNQLSTIQQTATHLKSVLAETELAKSVVSGTAVDDLEASAQKDKRIIIFTSKFVLEGYNSFTKVIIRNFRKGVKYEYYVPNDERGALDSYWSRVKEWYGEFSIFMQNKQKAESLLILAQQDETVGHAWNEHYVMLIRQYLTACTKTNNSQKTRAINNIKSSLCAMFTVQLVSYALDTNLFYVTVAMYEKEINEWRAIIKLPTENPQENYVAFSLDNVNIHEKESFVNNILHLPNGNPSLTIPQKVFS